MFSPTSAAILIWVLWGVIILPLAALRILQGRNTPKQSGSTWLAVLYFLGVLGTFGIAVCFTVAYDEFKDPTGPVVYWPGRTRYYIYIGSNIHLYTSYVVQCITLHLVSTTISRHVNTLAQRTPANPRGTNIGLGALVSLCYWLGTLVTILGFIATVCIEIFYCRGSSWHSLDDDPAKCPPWWSKLPLNSVAAIQFSAMALLIIAGGVVVLKVPRRGERVPGVTVGGVLMIIATALVAVRLALIGTRVRSPMDDGWERIGSLRLVEAVEVIVYLAAMFCVDLTKTGWKKKSQPEQLQMWTQYPPQPPPGYAYQVPPDGPPVYQMPPPAR